MGYPNVWGYMDTPQSVKPCFLCVVIVQQASKHHPNTWGHPNIWECPHIFRGCPNIGVPKHTGEYPNIWGHPNIQEGVQNGGIQTYRGYPNICGIQTYRGASKYMRGIQTYGGIQMYGDIWTPPQSDKACFICVVYVQQTSKHLPNMWGNPNI